MPRRKKQYKPHYTASDTADYYRFLRDSAYLTEKAYKEWLEHPNHELIAKFEQTGIPIPEDLQKTFAAFKKHGARLYQDMMTYKNKLEHNVKRLGRAKIRKAAETYRRPR